MLALNIVNRDYSDLFQPLDYDQGAPIGFMLVEKTFNLIFGRNEFSLRLFPLLIGLASLWLFYLLLKRSAYGAGFWVALTLFAFNPRLIYYSSEVKQYIVDVAVTIGLLLIALPLFQQASRKAFASLAFAGSLALWFSHPSLFVLAGIGLALFISYFQKRDFVNLRFTIGMGILWLVNLAFLYSLTLSDLRNNSYMHEYWQGAFAPSSSLVRLELVPDSFSEEHGYPIWVLVCYRLDFYFDAGRLGSPVHAKARICHHAGRDLILHPTRIFSGVVSCAGTDGTFPRSNRNLIDR